MLEKISDLFEDFLILLTQCALTLFLLAVVLVFFVGLLPLAAQSLEWLQSGTASSRDGFWLYALLDCGEQWCRPDSVTPTSWVGVNRIVNWIMGLHVVFYSTSLACILYGLGLAWGQSISDWKARVAMHRAPSLAADPDDAD